jgi:hypothetical protein
MHFSAVADASLDLISEVIEDYWEAKREPLALATLGHLIAARGVSVAQLLAGRRMREVLEGEQFASRYAVREKPGVALTWEVYPRSERNEPSPPASVEDAKQVPTVPRVPSAVWHAFTRVVSEGRRREITMPPFRFSDRQSGDPIGDGILVITPERVITKQPDELDTHFAQRVWTGILDWCDVNKVPISDLFERARSQSLLDRIMQVLSPDQLARTNLPMDVIAALREVRA